MVVVDISELTAGNCNHLCKGKVQQSLHILRLIVAYLQQCLQAFLVLFDYCLLVLLFSNGFYQFCLAPLQGKKHRCQPCCCHCYD